MMNKLGGWAFLSLMGCLLLLTLSLTVLSGDGAIVGSVVATLLGILAGGLYGAAVRRKE